MRRASQMEEKMRMTCSKKWSRNVTSAKTTRVHSFKYTHTHAHTQKDRERSTAYIALRTQPISNIFFCLKVQTDNVSLLYS